MSAYRMSDTSNKVSNSSTPSSGVAALQTNEPSTQSGSLPPRPWPKQGLAMHFSAVGSLDNDSYDGVGAKFREYALYARPTSSSLLPLQTL
ncbi:hypothetical protein L226DRAFT_386535 [Lentinus tigrinus ALCF2SS1-7]|uniref:uncharacterized protein n=1 Tax=Lentinus tigrinus ALCF2SS1-7 TaxID=1328758 RepID=UPI001165F190|nr:hypothetical protein L226DRAFT_400846 [Lentinus tigrinus ALCF2SS1-7]RPD67856.1 hypothetical protein L226DRAFT_386535 [Lentinus tigrinus ALCF2SS1-7]